MVKQPTPATLKKYGLSLWAWKNMLSAQGGSCYICMKVPKSGRLCIDHFHVKGWKKMPPEERVRHVRGLLCWTCNFYYCGRGINTDKARRLVSYLEAHDAKTK